MSAISATNTMARAAARRLTVSSSLGGRYMYSGVACSGPTLQGGSTGNFDFCIGTVHKCTFPGCCICSTNHRFYSSTARVLQSTEMTASMNKHFPSAVTNADLVSTVSETLEAKHGFKKSDTLVATSLCADEVNRVLEKDFSDKYDLDNFNMGGLAGFPFGGVTAFGAMASHIPDGGSTLVVFGPHVGVDSNGKVGTVERHGRASSGACCGSAVAAFGYVTGVHSGDVTKYAPPQDATDAQQNFVGNMLLPYAAKLADAGDDSMATLPYALYSAQKEMMDGIVQAGASNVAGSGKIGVLGGIQINTPAGGSDYFLPLSLVVFDNNGAMVEDLSAEINCGTASL